MSGVVCVCAVLCKRSFSSRTRACCWCPCGRVMRESVLVRAWPSSVAMRLRLTSMRSNGTKHVRDAAAFLCVVRVCGRWVWAARVHVMTYALELTADLRGAPRARRVLCGQRALVCISSTVTQNKTSEAHARPCRHGHQYTTLTRTTHKHAHSLRRRAKGRERERERRRPGSCPSPLLLLLLLLRASVRHADDLSIRIATR